MNAPSSQPIPLVVVALALLVLSAFGCKSTSAEVTEKDRALEATLLSGVDATRKIVDDAPPQEANTTCRKPGLTLNSNQVGRKDPKDGNTEVVHLNALWSRGERRYKTRWTDPIQDVIGLGVGPAVTIAHERRDRAPHQDLTPQKFADVERAHGVQQLIVLRTDREHEDQADVFLVEFPAAKIACGFRISVAALLSLPYRPYTGEPWFENHGAGVAERQALARDEVLGAIERELVERFGIVLGRWASLGTTRPPEDPDPTLQKAKMLYATMLSGLAKPGLPACGDPDPAEAVRTTTRRLRVYAGAPMLSEKDPNVRLEGARLISPPFREFIAASGPTRIEHAKKLLAAPATLVVDVESATDAVVASLEAAAVVNGRTESRVRFQPGSATVRQIRFDPEGRPQCVRRTTFHNSFAIRTVTTRDTTSALIDAARDDLRVQIEFGNF
jgi:hypothetical protein